MVYYKFEPACDTPEVGRQYPQVQKMSLEYDYNALNSVYALSREVEKFPEDIPNLNSFTLHSNAKLTDLLSVAVVSGGFLISEKLKMIFEEFKLVNHRFY